jgi:hypothetical protein
LYIFNFVLFIFYRVIYYPSLIRMSESRFHDGGDDDPLGNSEYFQGGDCGCSGVSGGGDVLDWWNSEGVMGKYNRGDKWGAANRLAHIMGWVCIAIILLVVFILGEAENAVFRWIMGIAVALVVVTLAITEWKTRNSPPAMQLMQPMQQ